MKVALFLKPRLHSREQGLTTLALQAFAPGMYHARFARQGKFWTIRLVKE